MMKKFLAMTLAASMLMAGTVTAFATADDETLSQANNASIEVRETDDEYSTKGDELTGVETELWLQVDATGQIDVTLPLVLVFKTDIDGGNAVSPNAYKIVNNSTADLVVKKVVKEDAYESGMTLVEWGEGSKPEETDKYKVQLSAGGWSWDVNNNSVEKDTAEGGLFKIPNDTTKETQIVASMITGPLSFITTRKVTEIQLVEPDEAITSKDDGMDSEKGVKLLTLTYTVAIDTSEVEGKAITTSPNNPATTPAPSDPVESDSEGEEL